MAADVHVVRIGMSVAEGEHLSALLPRLPEDVRARVLDQLWLRTVLVEQRRRTTLAERTAFDERGDRILELLDPQEHEPHADHSDWIEDLRRAVAGGPDDDPETLVWMAGELRRRAEDAHNRLDAFGVARRQGDGELTILGRLDILVRGV